MVSKKKMILILAVFIIVITGIRLAWYSYLKPADPPQAANGVLDLRGWTIPMHRTFMLNGEWEFAPYKLLTSGASPELSALHQAEMTYIKVPGEWKGAFPDASADAFRYGTYKLRIITDEGLHQAFKLRVYNVNRASAVYINGELAGEAGRPSDRRERFEGNSTPYTVDIPAGLNAIEIMIQVSNHAGEGGLTKPIRFGTPEAVDQRTLLSMSLQLLLCVVLFIHGLYAVMLYFMGAATRGLLYFSFMIICAIISVLIVDDRLLLVWFPVNYEWSVKLSLLSYIGVASFIPPLFSNMFPEYGNNKIVRWFAVYCAADALFVLIAPSVYALATMRVLLLSVLSLSILISGYILQKAIRKQEDVIYLLIACTALGNNIVWTSLQRVMPMELYYPFDLMIVVLAFAGFWFRGFFRSNAQSSQLAQKLQLANQQKDDFLVNTSHELRNPLHGIINMTQSVLDDPATSVHEVHRRKLETQITIAKRMSLMLDDLLDVARLKESTVRLQLGKVQIHSVMTGVAEMLRPMLDGKPILLHIDVAETFPAVKADENRLIQIGFNLLHNAIKFTDEGSIRVYADIDNGYARIHIADTGIGMDEETQRRIFLPYEQGESSIARAAGGFGLGLSICKQLVELQNGKLQVSSTPGQGSHFTFTLPLYEPTDQLETAQPWLTAGQPGIVASEAYEYDLVEASPASPIQKTKILAVDDDSVNLKILAEILGSVHYDITLVTSAAKAIARLETEHYDLVISDVMMPHMSGYEFTRFIRERFSISELPVLLLTARNRMEDVSSGFQCGANDYVTKPVEAIELRSRVQALAELKVSVEERLRMEAAWLQAQMEPHFFYNTINTIVSLGATDVTRMQLLLEEFSHYLRTSFDFNNSDRFVSLERELALIRSYLFIEQERFGDRLHVKWEVDPVPDLLLPPLAIQTLVENAVNHGIMKRSRGGTILIRIKEAAACVEVSVSDNGVGMSRDPLKQHAGATSEVYSGIGLRNTDRRLKQLYRQGLQIQSSLDQGTTVSFQIPYARISLGS